MANKNDAPTLAEVLATLAELMESSENDTVRASAARTLLERLTSEKDDEALTREAQEREAAIAEARCLLARTCRCQIFWR